MARAFRAAVRARANARCEYCRLRESHAPFAPFQLEHIVARQHKGKTSLSNAAWACPRCNLHKGPNLSGLDDVTKSLVKLFHPRTMKWPRHFRRRGALILGRTPIGGATVGLLQMNAGDRIELRQSLLDEGRKLD